MCPRNILVQQLECDYYRNYTLSPSGWLCGGVGPVPSPKITSLAQGPGSGRSFLGWQVLPSA